MSYKGQVPDKAGQPIMSVRLVNDADADSGVGTQLDPVRVDPVGTTVQPVSFSSPQHVIVDSGGGGGGGGPVTVADGADVAQGATTDAAVVTDVNGTLSAKLRGLVKIHASVWDSVNNRFKVDGSGVTQPISAAALPLPANASQDGTDATGVASPTGAVGIRGWLSSIYNILKNSTIGVTGTFFQATQPVSIAATISSNLAQVAAATVATAASGVQKVGVVGGAGTSLETTAGVIDNNVKNIGNAAVVTAASGVQKVGVVGNAGATFDATLAAGTAPTNGVAQLAQFNATAPAPTTGQTTSVQCNSAGSMLVSTVGRKATYRIALDNTVLAGGVTYLLIGSGTKIVEVTKVELRMSSSASAATGLIVTQFYAALPTSGTSVTVSAVMVDPNNAAATAVFKVYSVAPTGTSTANYEAVRLVTEGTTTILQSGSSLWQSRYGEGGQYPKLRTASQAYGVTFSVAQTATGFIEWTEE